MAWGATLWIYFISYTGSRMISKIHSLMAETAALISWSLGRGIAGNKRYHHGMNIFNLRVKSSTLSHILVAAQAISVPLG